MPFILCIMMGSLSLRGLKDARWPMVLAGVSYWLAGAPVCLLLMAR